ncbi:hypothetical protein [Streptomyces wuyuanensis]|uniref:hypothetical protein n=1 Tax=Streptomyces wuyuanensis TaxID=1196353 RepID=UPI003D720036
MSLRVRCDDGPAIDRRHEALADGGAAAISELGQADVPRLSATARQARHIAGGQEFSGGPTALLGGIRT